MARVTVEDCLDHVENRFDLVIKAAKRARDLELGAADPLVPKDDDKATVIALREIAQGFNVVDLPQDEEVEVSYSAEVMASTEPVESDAQLDAAQSAFLQGGSFTEVASLGETTAEVSAEFVEPSLTEAVSDQAVIEDDTDNKKKDSDDQLKTPSDASED